MRTITAKASDFKRDSKDLIVVKVPKQRARELGMLHATYDVDLKTFVVTKID